MSTHVSEINRRIHKPYRNSPVVKAPTPTSHNLLSKQLSDTKYYALMRGILTSTQLYSTHKTLRLQMRFSKFTHRCSTSRSISFSTAVLTDFFTYHLFVSNVNSTQQISFFLDIYLDCQQLWNIIVARVYCIYTVTPRIR